MVPSSITSLCCLLGSFRGPRSSGPAFVAAWKVVQQTERHDRIEPLLVLLDCGLLCVLHAFRNQAAELHLAALSAGGDFARAFLGHWRCGLIRPPTWVIHTALACFGLAGLALGVGLLMAGGQWAGTHCFEAGIFQGLKSGPGQA